MNDSQKEAIKAGTGEKIFSTYLNKYKIENKKTWNMRTDLEN